ncbi:hypothetical protein [Micromonospora sp. HK10]|uniref:hypothetical protein n=1 Tax=Micromonospora sp. HK10 TaxID=1538294 RepID=UPI0006270E2C|nr:hypothetical protein [Micromonospora sp. HK10]KKK07123.1 hypothetical protein LQ51_04235 [Micromonospora sp. HK10]
MAGTRRRPGSDRRPLAYSAVAVILVGLVLVSLRFVPGSPFRPSPASHTGTAGGRSTGAPVDRSTRAQPSPSPSLEPLPFQAQDLDGLRIKGWYSWAVLDKRTGKIIGSENMAETSTTASLIKSWVVADYLRRSADAGRTPSDAKLAEATQIIRDSNNERAQEFYESVGGSASIKRLISICKLTDSKVASDGGWSRTLLSPRDTARLGLCIDDGRAAGPKWTKWLINEMRLVRGDGDFGIRKAFPAAEQKRIAIKNGWIDRQKEREYHVNCLAIGDTWTMGVMVRTPFSAAGSWQYGMDTCEKVAAALLRDAA